MQHRRTGSRLALKPVRVWGIRIRLQVARKLRDLALFDLALDSKLRACDLVALRVSDLLSGGSARGRVLILQRKTCRPVQFEVTEQTRRSLTDWLESRCASADAWIFPSRSNRGAHLTTRQYARLLKPVGEPDRTGSFGLRHPQHAQDQGFAALQEDRQPPRLPAPLRARNAREHRQVPWCRGGRRSGAV